MNEQIINTKQNEAGGWFLFWNTRSDRELGAAATDGARNSVCTLGSHPIPIPENRKSSLSSQIKSVEVGQICAFLAAFSRETCAPAVVKQLPGRPEAGSRRVPAGLCEFTAAKAAISADSLRTLRAPFRRKTAPKCVARRSALTKTSGNVRESDRAAGEYKQSALAVASGCKQCSFPLVEHANVLSSVRTADDTWLRWAEQERQEDRVAAARHRSPSNQVRSDSSQDPGHLQKYTVSKYCEGLVWRACGLMLGVYFAGSPVLLTRLLRRTVWAPLNWRTS